MSLRSQVRETPWDVTCGAVITAVVFPVLNLIGRWCGMDVPLVTAITVMGQLVGLGLLIRGVVRGKRPRSTTRGRRHRVQTGDRSES